MINNDNEKIGPLLEAVVETGVQTSVAMINGDFSITTLLINTVRTFVKAISGAYGTRQKERVDEFVQEIIKHPKLLTKKVRNNYHFQEVFMLIIKYYVEERNKEKRRIAVEIFLGIAKADDKEKFEAERYMNALDSISSEGLEYLYMFKYNKQELEVFNASAYNTEREMQEAIEHDENPIDKKSLKIQIDSNSRPRLPKNGTEIQWQNARSDLIHVNIIGREYITQQKGGSFTGGRTLVKPLYYITPFGTKFLDFITS